MRLREPQQHQEIIDLISNSEAINQLINNINLLITKNDILPVAECLKHAKQRLTDAQRILINKIIHIDEEIIQGKETVGKSWLEMEAESNAVANPDTSSAPIVEEQTE